MQMWYGLTDYSTKLISALLDVITGQKQENKTQQQQQQK